MADSDQIQAETIKILSWAQKKKIGITEINAIIDLGFTSMDALSVATLEDIKKAKLSIGQQRLLTKALDETFREEATRLVAPGTGEINETVHADTFTDNREIHGNTEIQPGPSGHPEYEEAAVGNSFVQSLMGQFRNGPHGGNNGNAVPIGISGAACGNTGMLSWQDPQVYLKSRATTKSEFLDIVDFVDQSNNQSERVVSSSDGFELICRAGTKKPKLDSLSIPQWSSANLAILYKLVQDGILQNNQIFDYLSYTANIYSLMSSHDLVSVYTYDREYRKLQHQHKFRWGTAVSHLMVGHLRLKQTPPSQNGSKQKPKQEKTLPSGIFSSHTADGKVICKKFNNRSGCNFLNCKFEHVCNVPGCAKQHPGHQHGDSKNRLA